MTARTILLSGWRFVPHSYSIIAQALSLEFLKRPGLRVCFEDLPYFSPKWAPVAQLFGAQADAAFRALRPPEEGARLDADLRLGYPMDLLRPPRAARTMAFTTVEFLKPSPYHLPEGLAATEAQRRNDFPILTCSEWSREGLLNGGVPEDRVAVVPLGFDPDVFRPGAGETREACRAELGLAADDFVFFHASALTPNKGALLLLQAFARLLETHPHALLLLKGTDAIYLSDQNLARHLGALEPSVARAVQARIRYLGESVTAAAMARLYQAADCYVSPYLAEAFNMPVLEAAACGLPVICTGGGSTDDFVTDAFALRIESIRHPLQVTGMPDAIGLLPDPEHLLHLMLCAIDDAEFRDEARSAGPAHVGANFTWARTVDRLQPLLLEGRA